MNLNGFRGEFNADRRFRFQIEFIPCESGENVTFTNSRIANQHH